MTNMSLLKVMRWLIRYYFLCGQPWLLVEVWGNLPGKIPRESSASDCSKEDRELPRTDPCHFDLRSYCRSSLYEAERCFALEGTNHSGLSGSHSSMVRKGPGANLRRCDPAAGQLQSCIASIRHVCHHQHQLDLCHGFTQKNPSGGGWKINPHCERLGDFWGDVV